MQVLRAAISVSAGLDMNEPYELQIGDQVVAAAYGTFYDDNVEVAVVIFEAKNGLYGSVLTGSDLRGLEQFEPTLRAIIASVGTHPHAHLFSTSYTPPLSNKALFRRDQSLCLYCGERMPYALLSRDHVQPLSQGGADTWVNVVTACKRCNNFKAGRTPEQAGMELLAIPFTPTHAEYVYLQGRRILADQMEFLLSHFPRNSRLRQRVENGGRLLS